MKKRPVFLIPNVTSARNVGDEAMLEVLIELLQTNYPKSRILVHSSEPETHDMPAVAAFRPTLYYWAVFENRSVLSRLYRMGLVGLALIGLRLGISPLVELIKRLAPTIAVVLNDYAAADAIVYVGGGYLRSKSGFSQSLNLIMLLLPLYMAQFFKGKRIVCPISIGPFASEWHARLTGAVVREFEYLATREQFSYQTIAPYHPSNLVLSSDHALLLTKRANRSQATRRTKPVVGFTIREWLGGEKQSNLERSYVTALARIALAHKADIQPIVQVDAPGFGEGDGAVTERVVCVLRKKGVNVLDTQFVTSVEHGKQVYGALSVLVGMRMHSNIIAGTQGIPFVPVSYEYKTEGIAEDFGLAPLCIQCAKITPQKLFTRLHFAMTNRDSIARSMTAKLRRIQKRERRRWLEVLHV